MFEKSYKSKSLLQSKMGPEYPRLTLQQIAEVKVLFEGLERQLCALGIPKTKWLGQAQQQILRNVLSLQIEDLKKRMFERFKDHKQVNSVFALWLLLPNVLTEEDMMLLKMGDELYSHDSIGHGSVVSSFLEGIYYDIQVARGEIKDEVEKFNKMAEDAYEVGTDS